MKRFLILFFVFGFNTFNQNLNAQTLGLKGNFNFYNNDFIESSKNITGGIFFEKNIWKSIGLLTQVNYDHFVFQYGEFSDADEAIWDIHFYKMISPSLSAFCDIAKFEHPNICIRMFGGYYYSLNFHSIEERHRIGYTTNGVEKNYRTEMKLSSNLNGVCGGIEIKYSPFKTVSITAGFETRFMNLKNETYFYNSSKVNPNTLYLKAGFNFNSKSKN